jgi:hypothetical protein
MKDVLPEEGGVLSLSLRGTKEGKWPRLHPDLQIVRAPMDDLHPANPSKISEAELDALTARCANSASSSPSHGLAAAQAARTAHRLACQIPAHCTMCYRSSSSVSTSRCGGPIRHQRRHRWTRASEHEFDPLSGKRRAVQAFAMFISHSRHFYARGVFRMDQQAWVESHVTAFTFFKGVLGRIAG